MEEKKKDTKVENKKSNKKLLVIILIIILVIILGTIGVLAYINGTNDEKRASEIFGDEYCDAIMHIATRDLAPHICKICGVEFQDSSMREDICDECAEKTNRCNFCGKKLTDEIKAQREEMQNSGIE